MMVPDKLIECERYDVRSKYLLKGTMVFEDLLGSETVVLYLRAPYIFYEQKISELLCSNHRVLELGAGSGLHTSVLLRTGAEVIAIDISSNCLTLLQQRHSKYNCNLKTVVADMESLPFLDCSFDVVASAGSLSYGDNLLVMNEIHRVLRPGGCFICVDSINHNPIYRFNRWLHYLKGERTKSTLLRMPNMSMIDRYTDKFAKIETQYFGSISWMIGGVQKILGNEAAFSLSNLADRAIGVRKSAFKIVMVTTK
ncbi:MAG: class I SAM-dependent methyltransferase [Desulfobulbaceae bacterium]|nr:class I SAM-dependent methyltransferase [Desulfobulbaceae bacterium]